MTISSYVYMFYFFHACLIELSTYVLALMINETLLVKHLAMYGENIELQKSHGQYVTHTHPRVHTTHLDSQTLDITVMFTTVTNNNEKTL